MNHEELKQAAKDAISKLYGDTSVSQRTTYDDLLEIQDDIDVMLDAMEEGGFEP